MSPTPLGSGKPHPRDSGGLRPASPSGVGPAPEQCTHHWKIAAPAGATSHGVCRLCGSEADFWNISKADRKAPSDDGRYRTCITCGEVKMTRYFNRVGLRQFSDSCKICIAEFAKSRRTPREDKDIPYRELEMVR